MPAVRILAAGIMAVALAACAAGGPPPSAAPTASGAATAIPAATQVPTATMGPTQPPTAAPREPTPTSLPLPPKPSGLRIHEEMEAVCDPDDPATMCGIGDSTFTLRWKTPRMKGVEVRVYGVRTCFGADDDGRMVDGWCLREHTALPPSSRVLLAKAPASRGQVTFRLAQGPHWYATAARVEVYAFVVAAFRADGGHSVFAIADRGPYCSVADVACPGEAEDDGFAPGSWMATIVDGVRVRSMPGVSESSAGYTPLLPRGTEFEIVRGPVVADGYRWYLVRLAAGILDGGITRGWLADGSRDGDPWIESRGIDEG